MTDPAADDGLPEDDEGLEAVILARVLVVDVDPIPGLGDAPEGEPEEGYLEAAE